MTCLKVEMKHALMLLVGWHEGHPACTAATVHIFSLHFRT